MAEVAYVVLTPSMAEVVVYMVAAPSVIDPALMDVAPLNAEGA